MRSALRSTQAVIGTVSCTDDWKLLSLYGQELRTFTATCAALRSNSKVLLEHFSFLLHYTSVPLLFRGRYVLFTPLRTVLISWESLMSRLLNSQSGVLNLTTQTCCVALLVNVGLQLVYSRAHLQMFLPSNSIHYWCTHHEKKKKHCWWTSIWCDSCNVMSSSFISINFSLVCRLSCPGEDNNRRLHGMHRYLLHIPSYYILF